MTEPSRARRVVAVVAHPDDESYPFAGTLALCADAGAEVFVICATRGEKGWDLTGQNRRGYVLARVRAEELAASCRVIGARPPLFLELPDSGVREQRAEGERRLAAMLERIEPDVVLTLGEDGAYGHADHLACTQMVAATAPGRAGRVLHASFSPGLFAPVWEMVARGAPGVLGVRSADELGEPPEQADLVVDVRSVSERKLASVGAHVSQLPAGDPRRFLVDGLVDALLEQERYRLAYGEPLPPGASDPLA